MKKMILFSSLLMISALLYGAIDYFVSDRSGNLNGLYDPTALSQKVENVNSKGVRVSYANSGNFKFAQVVKKVEEKKSPSERKVSLEKFSRAALVEMPETDSLQVVNDSTNFLMATQVRVSRDVNEKK